MDVKEIITQITI